MEEKVAKFRFTNYKIVKSCFEINPNERGKTGNVSVEVKKQNMIDEGARSLKLVMTVCVRDEYGILNINLTIEGMFEFDAELGENQRNDFFDFNAPAILFPYVRAYVSALTSLSGFKPFVLPTINFAARKS